MSKVYQFYRELITSLSQKIREGERDIDGLIEHARQSLEGNGKLNHEEAKQVADAVHRDIKEFARSYDESHDESHEQADDSVFMRVIKESLWQELADITDKTQLEWKEVFQDLHHHGIYHSGEVVGLGNLVCEHCHFKLAIYTPEVLTVCPECGHNQFHREPFEP